MVVPPLIQSSPENLAPGPDKAADLNLIGAFTQIGGSNFFPLRFPLWNPSLADTGRSIPKANLCGRSTGGICCQQPVLRNSGLARIVPTADIHGRLYGPVSWRHQGHDLCWSSNTDNTARLWNQVCQKIGSGPVS